MKNIKIIAIVFTICGVFASCKDDFLKQKPVGAYGEEALLNASGVQQLLIGAYAQLNGDIQGQWASFGTTTPGGGMANIMGGEAHKGSTLTDQPWMNYFERYEIPTASDGALRAWRFLYDAVDRTNSVLRILPNVTDMTDVQKTQVEAEARFLRAHYYFWLKRWFKNIPWVDETATDVRVPNVDESDNYVNIWPQIQADFDFARKNLPPTQKDLGRPNSWAASAYYAKVLIYRGNEGDKADAYPEALTVINDIIANGVNNKGEKYALSKNYYDNFDVTKENNSETVFAVQHSVNDGTNNNSNGNVELQAAAGKNSASPGMGRGSGFYSPTQWFVDHFRVNNDGLPYLDMYATNPNSVKNDDLLKSSDPFTIETAPVDPRLDWSVGRRGIPYLDYGVNPGADWVYTPVESGPYVMKKIWIKKSEDAAYAYPGRAQNALNAYIIRYADVLLWAAELEARIGDLNKARGYVNRIRDRMASNPTSATNWVKKDDGTDAANYKIGLYPVGSPAFASPEKALDAILYERSLELGMEGHRFYDVIRFGKDIEEFNAYLNFESNARTFLKGAVYTRVPDMLLPIPQVAIDNSLKDSKNTLEPNPGY